MFDDRIFVNMEKGLDTHKQQGDGANRRELFSGLTQEQVEMDRRVRAEHSEMLAEVQSERDSRVASDKALRTAIELLEQRVTALENA